LICTSGADDSFAIDFSGVEVESTTMQLLEQEREELEAVLGRRVSFRRAVANEPGWVVRHPEVAGAAPELRRVAKDRFVSIVGSEADLIATISALHTLVHRDTDVVVVDPVESVDEAVALIREEIANTYPSFSIRGIDWEKICDSYLRDVPSISDFSGFAASWVAELGDAHTSIKTVDSGGYNPPYRGVLASAGVHLSHVPMRSAAYDAGVREGWVVSVADVAWWERTVGATPQQLSQVQARRALSFTDGVREFIATDPVGGARAQWREVALPPSIESTVQVSRDAGGGCVVQLRSFDARVDLHAVFDDLIDDARSTDRLTLDLRGNTGGSLLLATSLRDRFLRDETLIGSIAFSDGRGRLVPRRKRRAVPSERSCWPGSLEVLIDSMTYSASEDFILGLQGLEHVSVRGTVTGGGSGRPRRVSVLPGIDLTISTAVTYDREGHPVEFHGIRPDSA